MPEQIAHDPSLELANGVPSADAHDRLTAPSGAVPSSNAAGGPSLRDCTRVFARQPSPPLLFGAVALAVALRVVQGAWSWRDLVMPVGLVAVTPFVEWLIHVYLLHARPFVLFGRRVDMLSAREHRAHHEAPGVLEGVLIPLYAVAIFLAAIALTDWALSFVIALVIGGDRLAWLTSGVAVSFAILAAYEWTHFLIHTPYRPRRGYFKAIWRNHRLHHFKSERYWFGVTSTVGDRVIGTAPDQREVERSPTARSLHADA